MRVIGVIDVRGGQAVHARGGVRDCYEPVRAVDAGKPGDAVALANWYAHHLGLSELYVADLDAITGGAANDELVRSLAASHTVWLDAGISNVVNVRHASALGARHPVVGLETLTSYAALRDICSILPGSVAFSLDLRAGQPILSTAGEIRADTPEVIAARASDAGAHALIVLDLARVGMAAGLDIDLISRIRTHVPDVMLLAGGGVRGRDDLVRLADAGCDAALVATALRDGRIGAADLAAVGYRSVVRQTAD